MLNVLHLFRKYLRATVKATQLIEDRYFNCKKRIKKTPNLFSYYFPIACAVILTKPDAPALT